MKKISIIIIIASAVILFCSCGYFEVTCSIDDKNTVEMKINLNIDREGLSFEERGGVRSQLDDLIIYWENSLGYDVKEDLSDDDLYAITLSKKVECESKEEAIGALLKMMSSESSPFIDVEGGYSPSYLGDYYNIRAEVNLSAIVDYSFIDRLPQSERNYVLEHLDKFQGRIKFVLDGKTIDNIGSLNGETNSVNLYLNDSAEIYSLVEVANTDNIFEYDLLKNEISELGKSKTLYLILLIAAAGAVIIIAAVITVISVMRKGRKTAAEKIEPPSETASPDDGEN